MTPTEIKYWQTRLNPVLMQTGVETLTVDGDYGPKTRAAIEWVQVITGCHVDGDIGPETAKALESITDRYPIAINGRPYNHRGCVTIDCGAMPVSSARASTFGGPDDVNDRYYGQANIPDVDAPCDLVKYRKLTDDGLFRGDALALTQWPMTTDEQVRPKKAGTSWALDPRSFYAALRMSMPAKRKGDNCAKILVVRGSQACVCYLTDYGPATSTQCDIDLSPGAYEYLGLSYRGSVKVFWACDDSPIGPVNK